MASLRNLALSSSIFASALLLSTMQAPANAAAPPPPKSGGQSAAQTKAFADWQALSDLQNQLRETEKSDPKAAITQYKKYLRVAVFVMIMESSALPESTSGSTFG